jgi:hypothetical protein
MRLERRRANAIYVVPRQRRARTSGREYRPANLCRPSLTYFVSGVVGDQPTSVRDRVRGKELRRANAQGARLAADSSRCARARRARHRRFRARSRGVVAEARRRRAAALGPCSHDSPGRPRSLRLEVHLVRLRVFEMRIEVCAVRLQVAGLSFAICVVRFRVWTSSVGKPGHTVRRDALRLPIRPVRFRVSSTHLHLHRRRLRLLGTTVQLGA